jgi:hypothetical protein
MDSGPGSQNFKACNDAPFVAIGNSGWQISYVVLSATNDATGRPTTFAIAGPSFSLAEEGVPEPGALPLVACGLVAILWYRRKQIFRAR